MSKLLIAFSFLSTLLGCATTSHLDSRIDKRWTPPSIVFLNKWKNAPIEDLEKLSVGSSEDNIFWWKTYSLAQAKKKTHPEQSCENFRTLSQDSNFPLQDLALLRAHETCTAKDTLSPLPSNTASWYKDLLIDIKVQEATITPDLRDDYVALIEKARQDSNKKRKEDTFKQALAIAAKLELKDEQQQAQDLLFKNSPRLNPNPAPADLFSVAADHRFYREFEPALAIYEKILKEKKSSLEDQFSALKNIRQTFKVAQKRSEYINATEKMIPWAQSQFKKNKKDRRNIVRYHDSLVLLAKTLWTEDQTSRAVATLKKAEKELKGLYPLDEVYFILGRIDEEKGHFEKAIEWLEASYKEPVSMTGLRDKNAWLKSWNYLKLEKWEDAKNSFLQMRDLVKDPTDKSRARFWLARSLQKLGQTNESQLELENLIKEDPLGYYGVIAVRELKKNFAPLKNDNADLESLSLLGIKELNPQLRLTAEWLITLNETSAAEKIVNTVAENLRKQNVTDEKTWLAVSSAYARTGLYLPLFSAIGALQPEVKDRLLNDHPDLLFPQAFTDTIASASKKSGTPREFIYSIIRQESAFNPEARSPVDAFGLMQLLPSVAQQLAKQNSLEYREPLDLMKPEINIPLGAFELKTLMRKYDNQFILAVSGYNANDGAIRGWLKTRYRQDPLEFIEEVPYEETRTYIKLVLRNYVFYRRLLNSGQETVFPEDLLVLTR